MENERLVCRAGRPSTARAQEILLRAPCARRTFATRTVSSSGVEGLILQTPLLSRLYCLSASSYTMTYTRRETREATEQVRTLLSGLMRDRRDPKVVLEQQAVLCPPEPGMRCRATWDAFGAPDDHTPHICRIAQMLLCVRIARSTQVKVDNAELDMSHYHQAVMHQCCLPGVGTRKDRWTMLAFPRTGLLIVISENKNIAWSMTLPETDLRSPHCPCPHRVR